MYQYTKKRASGLKCPVTGKKIQGVSDARCGFFFYSLYFTLFWDFRGAIIVSHADGLCVVSVVSDVRVGPGLR